MKNIASCLTPLAVLLAFCVSSCSGFNGLQVEKRRYGKGYYVHVRKDRATEPVAAADPGRETAAAGQPENVGSVAPVEQENPQKPGARHTASASREKKSVKKSGGGTPGLSPATERTLSPVHQQPFRIFRHDPVQDDAETALVLVLLVILAIILPPLAVLLKEGLTYRFLLDLIFWLLGFGFILFIAGGYVYLGIFGLIAIIYALLIVLDLI